MSLLVTQPNAFILFCREAEAGNRRQESWEAGVQQASGVLTVILYDISMICVTSCLKIIIIVTKLKVH